MSKRFYITTAIDYPNGKPHIGHVYEKILADAYARWYRMAGYDVRFLTGTDENGQKLVKSAKEANYANPMEYVDENVEAFKNLCADLNLTNEDFIRTSEERHHRVTHEIWNSLEQKGDIYFDRYSGWYCYGCEAFYMESQVEDLKCPEHGTKLEHLEEDGFFFRMSAYQDWIINHIKEHAQFIFPRSARKEILSRLEGEQLRDLSVSRPNGGWGIQVPSREGHVIYTWFDALINYYAAVRDEPLRSKYWPASMHVIGKDITWFHTVIWPIMLHAAGIKLPDQVHVHGMILAEDGRKMSKSLHNVVDPNQIIDHFAIDLLRYYLLRAIPSGGDGRFSINDMIDRNNNELANDFGNLALRVIKLSAKRIGDEVTPDGVEQIFNFSDLGTQMHNLMEQREHHRALDKLWEGINQVNAYLNEKEPWRIKDNPDEFKQHMYNCLYAIHCFATLMEPFVPDAAAKTLHMLGTKRTGLEGLAFGEHRFKFTETESLFPKLEYPESE